MSPQQITFQHPPGRANSFPHTLFRTLCRCRKTQLLCNQANPHSFSKTPGVWVSLRSRAPHHPIFALPVFSRTYKSLPTSPSDPPLCFHRLTNCPLCPIDFFLLCFHAFTNCFFSNSFAFTNICIVPCFFSPGKVRRGGAGRAPRAALPFHLSTFNCRPWTSPIPRGRAGGNTACPSPGLAGGVGAAAGRRCVLRNRFQRC
jgi:hypothetical protein